MLPNALRAALGAAALLASVTTASAQSSGGLLDGLFSRGGGTSEQQQGRVAQMSDSDVVMRLDRLENQIRQLTGTIEQLQFRNQQLEQQFKRMQDDTEYRFQEISGRGGAAGTPPMRTPAPAQPQRRGDAYDPAQTASAPAAAAAPGTVAAVTPAGPRQRGDAFDPSQNPNAPGAPRTLGQMATNGAYPSESPPPVISADESPQVGAPGGRNSGSPLDLSTLSGAAANDPSLAPGGAARGNANPQLAAVQPPSQSPRDEYDLGYGYVLRKDYPLAVQTLRGFVQRYPSDKMVPEAEFWIGESLFQQQRYRDAAESFLKISTKYDTTGKAPDALLRLGQSLAALGEKDTACAALGEVLRKYPRATASVKQGVEREQKRVKC